MNVTTELVDKLANLTMLQFNEEEKKDIQNDLQSMISFVEKLQELDTNGNGKYDFWEIISAFFLIRKLLKKIKSFQII